MAGTAGLVLTGGGARAAYQVGAIRALAQITAPKHSPFPIIAGMSAGAINAAALAADAGDFREAATRLGRLPSTLNEHCASHAGDAGVR
jgi:NTE family protein